MNNIQQAQALGQGIWLDYIRRGLLKSGELKQLVEQGLSGLTANPTIMEKAIIGSTDYDEALAALASKWKGAAEIYETLAIEDIQTSADLMRSVYDRTSACDGYPCLEISPLVAYDTEKTTQEGRRLFKALNRSNIMVKVPATPQGIPAIRQLTSEGINVNVTLIFSLDYYDQVMEAYISGLEELVRRGGDSSKVASVASFFLSRIDTLVDSQLDERINQGQSQLQSLLGKAALSSAKLAYQRFKSIFYGQRFAALKAKGAQVQRVLWASTGTKNPAYPELMYVEPLIGRDTVNTLPLPTLQAFIDHGHVANTVEQETDEAERTLIALAAAGIDMKKVTDKLLADGVTAFSDSFNKLMAGIEEKKTKLAAPKTVLGTHLGQYETAVKQQLEKLSKNDTVSRVWRKDHTVWKSDPTEIANRLGWLTVTEIMREHLLGLISFAEEIRNEGFRHVVLLGMGGSSLGAEVLRQVFGSARGFPELIVLDSTVPAAVVAVNETIDPARTLFLVSSKSGTTTEPLVLYKFFREKVEQATGHKTSGHNFVAITDPGTPLATLAAKEGFRHAFLNPSDIGGRYSVLSYFGMVPAALIGTDVASLFDRADSMREGCASCVPHHQNHGLWLGACLGTLALKGRDKLTLVTSPSLDSFGLWVEQLIAESTGKEGKGIIPVASEPLASPASYGPDRVFVYLRNNEDNNSTTDDAISKLISARQPAVLLEMPNKLDLGAEFFRWEFAMAVAGAVLGIHPFNQPDVQKAKDVTEGLLHEYSNSKHFAPMQTTGSLKELLAKADEGKYLAIMAYLRETPETDKAFAELRRKVVEKYHIATTFGYGPRFLHSTGQLHKGGPDTGLFLQITADHDKDVPIPGEAYSFGAVADAQALGDFQALRALGRPAVRIHLACGDASSIAKITAEAELD